LVYSIGEVFKMLLKDCRSCSTNLLNALDKQLIAEMLDLAPGALVDISKMPGLILADSAAHPYLVPAAAKALEKAISSGGIDMVANSIYRTIAQQMLLFTNQGRCKIVAAPPGDSNHQGGGSIDIEEPYWWQIFLEVQGWKKLGDWDRMHFDYPGADIRDLSVRAFQRLCNKNGLKLTVDGGLGERTLSALRQTPIEGFAIALTPRTLKLTSPLQQGDDVLAFQQKLGIKADGFFGEGTSAAAKQWQLAQGLTADGTIGAVSRQKIGLA
jgi:N-acetylmuramoyl-L-alanine amidase